MQAEIGQSRVPIHRSPDGEAALISQDKYEDDAIALVREQQTSNMSVAVRENQTSDVTISVSLRIRPTLGIDGPMDAAGNEPCDMVTVSSPGLVTFQQKQFSFTNTFDEAASQCDIFEAHRNDILNVLAGFDATIMCYGATGSGKTYTCQGTDEQPGIIPRALDALFERIEKSDGVGSLDPRRCYIIQTSALEIVENRVVDLLHGRAAVTLRAAPSGELHFHGLTEIVVSHHAQLSGLVQAAIAARTVGMNYRHGDSSRSHFVLRIRVDALLDALTADSICSGSQPHDLAVDLAVARAGDRGGEGRIDSHSQSGVRTSAVLTFVDLAGSEAALQNRSPTAVAQGLTINKSLHCTCKPKLMPMAPRHIPRA